MSAKGPTRFFQIGFQRCGTPALAAFFNRCGIASVHHDRGRLALRMRENLATGARPLEGYEHYRAFTNMDHVAADDWFEGFRHYRALDAACRARFILNTRPVEHWLRSLMAHYARRAHIAAPYVERRFGTSDPEWVAAHWRAQWEAHHRAVRADIPRERLLVFDIESDPPERLCDFVGVPRDHARHWRRENPTLGALGNTMAGLLPLALKRAVPDRVKLPVKRLLRARR